MAKFVLSAFSDEAGKPLEEQIAALQRNNIKYMEIRGVNGVNISKIPLETVKEYRAALDAAGIRVLTVGSPIGKVKLGDSFDDHMAKFLHTLGAAKILGAERIRMFSIIMEGADPAPHRETVLAHLREMIDIARGTGITLYHENEKDIYGDTDTRVRELMDLFGDEMKFIFDPANFIQCDCDPLAIYPKLKDKVSYFHIKDALKENGEVVPAGMGDGHIAEILADFAKDHDNVMLTVEPHLMSFAGLKDSTSINDHKTPIYKDNNESFDVAVNAIKNILEKEGLSYE